GEQGGSVGSTTKQRAMAQGYEAALASYQIQAHDCRADQQDFGGQTQLVGICQAAEHQQTGYCQRQAGYLASHVDHAHTVRLFACNRPSGRAMSISNMASSVMALEKDENHTLAKVSTKPRINALRTMLFTLPRPPITTTSKASSSTSASSPGCTDSMPAPSAPPSPLRPAAT